MEGRKANPFHWQSRAAEEFSARSSWADFVNLAARMPQLDFPNQLVLSYQVRERGANARAFAARGVWEKFGYSVAPDSEPFRVRGVLAETTGTRSPRFEDRDEGWVSVYERWQVDGGGDGVPQGLTASHIAQTSPDGLAERLEAFAAQRGLRVVETDPKYLPNQAASLVYSRTEGINRLLIRKDATDTQRCRGLVGTLTADILSRLPGSRNAPAGLRDLNPFVASGVRHIVTSANGLTDKRYQGVPQAPWPAHADANTVSRWGEVTSVVANGFLAATATQPQRILPPAANLAVTADLTREARRHKAEQRAMDRQSAAESAVTVPRATVDTSLIDSICGDEPVTASSLASAPAADAGSSGHAKQVAENVDRGNEAEL